jgi:hypothetical protein
MAYLLIPVRTDLPAYEFSITLESVIYILSFEWNDRGQFWTMDILDQDQNYLVAGIRMVSEINLLRRFKNTKLPAGDFILNDTSSKGRDPSFFNFGTEILLFYRESTTVD